MAAGRPPKYETAEELESRIQEYKKQCVDDKTNLTITGLCYYLGFQSRQSFYDLGEKDEFTYTIKRAHLLIESSYEQRLWDKNSGGAIFALKNLGWSDKQEIDHTSGGKQIQFPIEIVNGSRKKDSAK